MNDQDHDHSPETLCIGQPNGRPYLRVSNDSPELAIAFKQKQFDEVSKALLELVMHMENRAGQSML